LVRFEKCIHASKPSVSYDVHILRTSDPEQKPNYFNKSKLLNKGIKNFCNGDYEVVIQTDIDLIVPPNLIDVSYQKAIQQKVCYHVNHRRITHTKIAGFPNLPEEYDKMNWSALMKFPKEASNGCWNAMNHETWWDTGGYNENCINWSREDDDHARRAKIYGKVKYIVSNDWPLIHINHPQRNQNNRKHNDTVVRKAIEEGKINWLT
jgi:hypothetical protein